MKELSFMVVMVTITKLLNKSTMHKFFMYQMTTPSIQVNVTSNIERLDPPLYTMVRLTLIHLMQMFSLLMFHHLLNKWNLLVKRFIGLFVCLFVCFFNTSMITRKKNILHQDEDDNQLINECDDTFLKKLIIIKTYQKILTNLFSYGTRNHKV